MPQLAHRVNINGNVMFHLVSRKNSLEDGNEQIEEKNIANDEVSSTQDKD